MHHVFMNARKPRATRMRRAAHPTTRKQQHSNQVARNTERFQLCLLSSHMAVRVVDLSIVHVRHVSHGSDATNKHTNIHHFCVHGVARDAVSCCSFCWCLFHRRGQGGGSCLCVKSGVSARCVCARNTGGSETNVAVRVVGRHNLQNRCISATIYFD